MENKAQKYISKVLEMNEENNWSKRIDIIFWPKTATRIYSWLYRYIGNEMVREKYKNERRLWNLCENFRYKTLKDEELPIWFSQWRNEAKEKLTEICSQLYNDIDKLMDYIIENEININSLYWIGQTTAEKFINGIQNYYAKQ